MTETVSRILRSLIQFGGPATIITFLLQFDVIHWTSEQSTAASALVGMIVSVVQNAVEQKAGKRLLAAKK